MKLTSAGLVLSLASIVVAQTSDPNAAPSDYFEGKEPTDFAPDGCAKPTAFFNCYKPVTKYWYCDANDDACNCSSVMIDKSCINQHCGTATTAYTHDSSLYCTGTATVGMSAAAGGKTASPAAPASTEATPTASSTPTGQTTTTPSGSAASTPNAGERSSKVSTGGLVAVAAAAMGWFAYRL